VFNPNEFNVIDSCGRKHFWILDFGGGIFGEKIYGSRDKARAVARGIASKYSTIEMPTVRKVGE